MMADSSAIALHDRSKQYEQGLFPYVITGNPQGENLIFLAGYPDDELSGWAPLIDLLKHKYQIIALCFPQFDENPTKLKKWAYSFEELVDMLDKTLASTPAANQPYTLITHDWGAAVGYLYENKFPEKVSKMVAVDVGQNVPISWRIVLYQALLAIVYISSQVLGNAIANVLLSLYHLFMNCFPFLGVRCSEVDARYIVRLKPTVHMTYPYYYMCRAIVRGQKKKVLASFPSCPLLYMYGEQKRCMFHGKRFLDKIEASPLCSSIGFPESGHWVMHAVPEKMSNHIEKFLASHSS